MARSGRYTHVGKSTTSQSVDTTFGTGKRHTLALRPGGNAAASTRRQGTLGALYVYLDTIVTAATVTVRVTRDAAGDECLMPDTASTIYTGVSTAADGSAVFDLDIPFALLSQDEVYVFLKLDAGTATWGEASLTWQE